MFFRQLVAFGCFATGCLTAAAYFDVLPGRQPIDRDVATLAGATLVGADPIGALRTVAAAAAEKSVKSIPTVTVSVSATLPPKSAPATGGAALAALKPADDGARAAMTRDIQAELQRVGCFRGRANGRWTASTQRAAAAFSDGVNAKLPVDGPDYALLSLVRARTGIVCGAANAPVVAATEPGPAALTVTFTAPMGPAQASAAVAAVKPAQAPLPGRMALGVEGPPAPEATGPVTAGDVERPYAPVTTKAPSAPPPVRRSSTQRSIENILRHPLGEM